MKRRTSHRPERVAEAIRQTVAAFLTGSVRDPRGAGRRGVGTDRVGALGKLGPFAWGLLVLVLGRAPRLALFAAGWAKAYDGRTRLGPTTATDDTTGATVAPSEAWRGVDRGRVEEALAGVRGAYDQRPPAYSAVEGAR